MWLCHQIIHSKFLMRVQFLFGVRFSAMSPLPVNLTHSLYHLEQPWPATDTVTFQCGRHGKTDGLFRPCWVGHDKKRVKWIKPSLYTFHGSVE